MKKVKKGEIVDILNDRLYVLDANTEELDENMKTKDSIIKSKSIMK